MTGTEIVFNINEITSLRTKDDVVEKKRLLENGSNFELCQFCNGITERHSLASNHGVGNHIVCVERVIIIANKVILPIRVCSNVSYKSGQSLTVLQNLHRLKGISKSVFMFTAMIMLIWILIDTLSEHPLGIRDNYLSVYVFICVFCSEVQCV